MTGARPYSSATRFAYRIVLHATHSKVVNATRFNRQRSFIDNARGYRDNIRVAHNSKLNGLNLARHFRMLVNVALKSQFLTHRKY
jgi:hypothetical protein